jgi:hypothetical protein
LLQFVFIAVVPRIDMFPSIPPESVLLGWITVLIGWLF